MNVGLCVVVGEHSKGVRGGLPGDGDLCWIAHGAPPTASHLPNSVKEQL